MPGAGQSTPPPSEGDVNGGRIGPLDFFLDIIFGQGYESHHGYRHKTDLSDGSQELVVAQLQQGGAPVCVEIV